MNEPTYSLDFTSETSPPCVRIDVASIKKINSGH